MARAKPDAKPAGGWLGPNTPGGGKDDLPSGDRETIGIANGIKANGDWKWKWIP